MTLTADEPTSSAVAPQSAPQSAPLSAPLPAPIKRPGAVPAVIRYPMKILMYGGMKPLMSGLAKTGILKPLARRVGRQQLAQMARAFDGYQPDEHDVFVCTFFKSGTNWTMQIALQIAFRGNVSYEHIHDLIPWPDAALKQFSLDIHNRQVQQASPTGFRVIKTHLNLEHVPFNDRARYITVIRDPKDVFVSSYYFVQSMGLDVLFPGVATWLDLFLSPDFLMNGSWAKYVAGYWSQRHHPGLLILNYKQMKRDLPGTVRQIAEFMGVDLTPEEFQAVCDQSTFSYMKQIDDKFGPGVIVPWRSENTVMLRSGKHGGSSELLTLEQQRRIDNYFVAELKEIGSDFPYSDFCDPA